MPVSNRDGIQQLDREIERLDQKVALLRKQRDVLADAQDVLNSLFNGGVGASPVESTSSGESTTSASAGKRTKGSPRRAAVIAYIKEHGPTKRATLVEATGIPVGTISYLLNDKTRFRRLENGTWDVRQDDAGLPLDQDGSPAQNGA